MKEKGIKVGSLKFISECNSINLKQYKSTHKIIDHNKIHIMGIKKPLREFLKYRTLKLKALNQEDTISLV